MSTNNLNVLYEVGYAHATNKLCILLTKNPKTIPFDLKNRRHILFSSLNDLKAKLLKDLEALKAEAELSFDKADAECVATVPVNVINTTIVGTSKATSIRVKVKTNSEIHSRNVPKGLSNAGSPYHSRVVDTGWAGCSHSVRRGQTQSLKSGI